MRTVTAAGQTKQPLKSARVWKHEVFFSPSSLVSCIKSTIENKENIEMRGYSGQRQHT